ncbi:MULTISPECIES: CS1 type fimbrial major subunit [unclassified Burkholderia]|uniref:CS1 type fimbrial major subunit n=1 Tax=unclassified Burkholderia TaxID=2613784 RepID=UPI0019165DB8|nr:MULTISPECIES: CS1 type fimbrial major subunit [unclassified Burkholderia]
MHQSIVRACLLGAVAIAGTAHAEVKQQSFEIKLSAEVPAVGGFEIKEEGWNSAEPLKLDWNEAEKKFDTKKKSVFAKSGVGNVQVKFSTSDELKLSHQTKEDAFFKLGVKVGGKDVGTDPVEVVTKDEAKNGKSIEVEITPGAASDAMKDGLVAGDYTGTVSLMFETKVDG